MTLDPNMTLQELIAEVSGLSDMIGQQQDILQEYQNSPTKPPQILAEMRALAHNMTVQANAIEERITRREEKHAELEVVVQENITNQPISAKSQALATGYTDGTTGIKIKATSAAQTRFTSLLVAMDTALELGAVNNSTLVTFYDYNDETQQLPLLEFKALMLRYAAYCQYVEAQY